MEVAMQSPQEFTPDQYEAALVELLDFVTTHLDPDPAAQWAAYFTSPGSIKLVAHMQVERALSGLSNEPDELVIYP
jgi:hypothetical protein